VAQREIRRLKAVLDEVPVAVGVHVKRAVDDADVEPGPKVVVIFRTQRPVAVHVQVVQEVGRAVHEPAPVQDAEVRRLVKLRVREVHVHAVEEVDIPVVVHIDVEIV
jgi:hypothetical protein